MRRETPASRPARRVGRPSRLRGLHRSTHGHTRVHRSVREATSKKIIWIQGCHGLDRTEVVDEDTWQVLYYPALDCYDSYPRLLGLGATKTAVGQGSDRNRVVMADPEGNEFDVLRTLAPPNQAASGHPHQRAQLRGGRRLGMTSRCGRSTPEQVVLAVDETGLRLQPEAAGRFGGTRYRPCAGDGLLGRSHHRRGEVPRGRPGRETAELRVVQLKGTASVGEVCQLVTIGSSTVMVPTGRETGLGSSSPTPTMMLSSSLPPFPPVLFGFTPA